MDNQVGLLTQLQTIQIERVVDGVYAAIPIPGRGSVGNAGIIDLGGRTVIFDTLRTPAAAEELRRAAEHLTGRPARWIVNSHWHDDHVAGNQVFVGADILATEQTRHLMATQLMADYAQDPQELPAFLQKLATQRAAETDERKRETLAIHIAENELYQAAIPDITVTLPNQTFERRLVLHGASRTAEILSYGGGHTVSDAFLYLPDEQLLFAGDLAFLNLHPWLTGGDPDEWQRILQQIKQLPLRIVIPGHGPVSDSDCLTLTGAYITALTRAAEHLISSGASTDDIAGLPVPAPFEQWEYGQFFPVNMRFLIERLKAQSARS